MDINLARFKDDLDSDGSFVTGSFSRIEGSDDYGLDVCLQSDGKILVAGFGDGAGGDEEFLLVRYRSDGFLDEEFGNHGWVKTNIGSGDDLGRGVAVQADGKILVAGKVHTSAGSRIGLVRYKADGTLDTSFNQTGKVITSVGGGESRGNRVLVQPDGRIVVIGRGGDAFAVVRYLSDGRLDNSFGADGRVSTKLDAGTDEAFGAVLQADGKLLVVGTTSNYKALALVRYATNGSLDRSFNGSGFVITSDMTQARSVALQADRKIVVAGHIDKDPGDTDDVSDFAIMRFDSDGSQDLRFGNGGLVIFYDYWEERALAVAVQSDGKVLVSGYQYGDGTYSGLIVRLIADDPPGTPAFAASPEDQSVAEGAEAVFNADATGDPAPTYQWYHGNSTSPPQPLLEQTSATLTLMAVTASDAGSYYVEASNDKGTVRSLAAILTVLPPPGPRIAVQPQDVRGDGSRPLSLSVGAIGEPPLTYQWFREDGTPVEGAIEPVLTLDPTAVSAGRERGGTFDLHGFFQVQITDPLGRSTVSRTAQVAARGKALPAPRLRPTSGSFTEPFAIELTHAVPGARIHFTTDGSIPDVSSPIFGFSPTPTIYEQTTVRAMAVLPGQNRLQSPVVAVTYSPTAPAVGNPERVLGSADGRLLEWETNIGLPISGPIDREDTVAFRVNNSGPVQISVSEVGEMSKVLLELFSRTGLPIGYDSSTGEPLRWEGPLPAGEYRVRVRLPLSVRQPGRWQYRLRISAGKDWGVMVVGTRAHHVALRRLPDGQAIERDKPTWVLIHGKNLGGGELGSDQKITGLGDELGMSDPSAQVVYLDWKTLAAEGGVPGRLAAKTRTALGKFLRDRLVDLGITGDRLNFAGHSWGTYVAHEAATKMSPKPRRLVALDPASQGGSDVHFDRQAQWSWAFWSSPWGERDHVITAHNAFVVKSAMANQPIYTEAHDAAVRIFRSLLIAGRSGNASAARFGLDQISRNGHWASASRQNRYEVKGSDPLKIRDPALRRLINLADWPWGPTPTTDTVLRPATATGSKGDKGYPFEAVLQIDGGASVITIVP